MAVEFVTSSCCLPELSRAELFEAIRTAGYQRTELFATWTKSKFLDSDDRASIIASGPGVSAVHLPGDVGAAKKIITRAANCGIGQVVVHGTGKPMDAAMWLKPLVVHARSLGVEVVLTNHKGQTIESPEDMQTAINACGADKPGILLEAGQFWATGHDALSAFRRFQKDVRLIHIKDLDGTGRSVAFGSGVCPIAEFLGEIGRSEYGGRIVIEVEMRTTPTAQVVEILQDARMKCAGWLNAQLLIEQ
jgi:sugar phosphate isomerase/epimerase